MYGYGFRPNNKMFGGGGSTPLPISNLFAYSFRRVVPTATVSFRVRRSSDNAEQDIGFVGNDLDTASLTSFVGANNGFVTKIYEQNGGGIDLTQTVATGQFQIVVSGVVNTMNGKPSCITGTSNAKYMLTTSLFNPSVVNGVSIFSVTKPITHLGGGFASDWLYAIGAGGGTSPSRFFDHAIGGTAGNPTNYVHYTQNGVSLISTPYTSGTKLQGHLIKSGNNKYYQNNVLVGSNTTSLVTPSINQRLVVNGISWTPGSVASSNQYFSEILIYNSDETSNLTTIQNNINTYYSIY